MITKITLMRKKLTHIDNLFYDLIEIGLKLFDNHPLLSPFVVKGVHGTVLAYLFQMPKKKEPLRGLIQPFVIVSQWCVMPILHNEPVADPMNGTDPHA